MYSWQLRVFRSADLICRCLRLVFVLHARTQARADESMHLTGVRRSAEWHSGTQALEVQESARAGAHAETGTNACRSIGQRTTSTAEWCQ